MIQTRREDPPPNPDEIRDRRISALERRLDAFEAGQSLSWTFAAATRGEDLERRMERLAEAVRTLAELVDGTLDLLDDSPSRTEAAAEPRALAARLDDLEDAIGESAPFFLIEALASALGLPPVPDSGRITDWAEDLELFPARNLTGPEIDAARAHLVEALREEAAARMGADPRRLQDAAEALALARAAFKSSVIAATRT